MSEKLMDWAGESVDRDSCPPCTKHPDCFACVEGYCTALRIPDGRISKKKRSASCECPFYKPIQQVKESGARCYQRLKELGRRDLIDKYADTLIVTGAMDEEGGHSDRSVIMNAKENNAWTYGGAGKKPRLF